MPKTGMYSEAASEESSSWNAHPILSTFIRFIYRSANHGTETAW